MTIQFWRKFLLRDYPRSSSWGTAADYNSILRNRLWQLNQQTPDLASLRQKLIKQYSRTLRSSHPWFNFASGKRCVDRKQDCIIKSLDKEDPKQPFKVWTNIAFSEEWVKELKALEEWERKLSEEVKKEVELAAQKKPNADAAAKSSEGGKFNNNTTQDQKPPESQDNDDVYEIDLITLTRRKKLVSPTSTKDSFSKPSSDSEMQEQSKESPTAATTTTSDSSINDQSTVKSQENSEPSGGKRLQGQYRDLAAQFKHLMDSLPSDQTVFVYHNVYHKQKPTAKDDWDLESLDASRIRARYIPPAAEDEKKKTVEIITKVGKTEEEQLSEPAEMKNSVADTMPETTIPLENELTENIMTEEAQPDQQPTFDESIPVKEVLDSTMKQQQAADESIRPVKTNSTEYSVEQLLAANNLNGINVQTESFDSGPSRRLKSAEEQIEFAKEQLDFAEDQLYSIEEQLETDSTEKEKLDQRLKVTENQLRSVEEQLDCIEEILQSSEVKAENQIAADKLTTLIENEPPGFEPESLNELDRQLKSAKDQLRCTEEQLYSLEEEMEFEYTTEEDRQIQQRQLRFIEKQIKSVEEQLYCIENHLAFVEKMQEEPLAGEESSQIMEEEFDEFEPEQLEANEYYPLGQTDLTKSERLATNNISPAEEMISSQKYESTRLEPIIPPSQTKSVFRYRPDQPSEYIVLTPRQKLINTAQMPLQDESLIQDTFSVLSQLENPQKYRRSISKLETQGWKIVGGGGPTGLIVFERNIKDGRRRRRARLVRIASRIGFFTALFMTGSVLFTEVPSTEIKL